jgi:Co/Zn/Cd efflux system component
MSCCADLHCSGAEAKPPDRRYRRVLWIALAINATLFIVEIVAGLKAASVSLQADALDFLADTANYGISLFVIGLALRYRATAALAKGTTMGVFGLWVMTTTLWHVWHETLPQAAVMGVIGLVALGANGICFGLLWSHRNGDSNMRAVWVCTRNDVIGNLGVLLAALGVFGTGTRWPDVMVAGIMACLALQGAWQVIRLALTELQVDQRDRDNPGHITARMRRFLARLRPVGF